MEGINKVIHEHRNTINWQMMNKLLSVIILVISVQLLNAQQPFILGRVDTITSSVMNEKRILNIYLPDGYHPDSIYTYPVIYLLDGSADEDFIHVAGLIQFYNFPWINKVPKCILVGIANVNRKRDFSFKTPNLKFLQEWGYDTTANQYGGSSKFITFIEKELQPYINNHYKTDGVNAIIGQSLGGLLATEIFLKHPSLFNYYMILSPSLWWNKESLLKEAPSMLQKNIFNKNTRVYVGVGKEGKTMVNDAKKLFALIKKYKKDIPASFGYFKNEDHGSMSHIALYDGLGKIFAKSKK